MTSRMNLVLSRVFLGQLLNQFTKDWGGPFLRCGATGNEPSTDWKIRDLAVMFYKLVVNEELKHLRYVRMRDYNIERVGKPTII